MKPLMLRKIHGRGERNSKKEKGFLPGGHGQLIAPTIKINIAWWTDSWLGWVRSGQGSEGGRGGGPVG